MKPIQLRKLGKTFHSLHRGKVAALKDVSLEIEPGEFFVLLGPSGCGKSTLLNIIAGIEKPSSGEIKFGEDTVVSAENRVFLTPKQRDVAMVFQSYALYPHLTVSDNLAFPLKIAKVTRREIQLKVEDMARTLELSSLLAAKPAELSGGQRQRVALGRALIRQPEVLLLDEPLSNLDAVLRISMRSILKELQRQFKITTVYVTHDQSEAMALGDRIAVLKEGELLQVGTPEEVYKDPHWLFVAKFIGSPAMNLFSIEDADLDQLGIDPDNLPDKASVTLGIRPEHLSLVEQNEGVFRGQIKLISSFGDETLVHLDVRGEEVVVKRSGAINYREGDPVGLDLEEQNLYFFDRTTGQRIRL